MTNNLLLFMTFVLAHHLSAQTIPITSTSKKAIEHYETGWLLEDKLKLEEAEIHYRKALAIDSSFAMAHLRLGMVRDNYVNRREKINDALKYIDNVSQGEKLWILARQDFYSLEKDYAANCCNTA